MTVIAAPPDPYILAEIRGAMFEIRMRRDRMQRAGFTERQQTERVADQHAVINAALDRWEQSR